MEILREAGVDRVDAVLCVTDDDKTQPAGLGAGQDGGGAPGHRAGQRPDNGAADGAAGDRRLCQSARDHGHPPARSCATSGMARVRGVYSVGDAEAEVIEAQVLSTSSIAGKQIREIDFPGRRAGRRGAEGRQVDAAQRVHPDRGGRQHRHLLARRRRARGRGAPPGLDRFLLSRWRVCSRALPFFVLLSDRGRARHAGAFGLWRGRARFSKARGCSSTRASCLPSPPR